MTDLADLDGVASAQLVRKGDITPREMVQAAIDRIEAIDPQLNAVVIKLYDQALKAAEAPGLKELPFGGVPIVIKDLSSPMAGVPHHCGSNYMKRIDWREPEDLHVVAELKKAGFIILGKTATPEFGNSAAAITPAFGEMHNPWRRGLSGGGSSTGTAVAIATRMVALGHGGDGGGSVRLPATACGVVALKPSRGRISAGPGEGDPWNGMVVRGPLSRTMRDCAALTDLWSKRYPGDPYNALDTGRPYLEEVSRPLERLRIGVVLDDPGGVPLHPDVRRTVEAVANLLRGEGHHVEETHPKAWYEVQVGGNYLLVVSAFKAWWLSEVERISGQACRPEDLEPLNWERFQEAKTYTAVQYVAATEAIHAWARRLEAWWLDWDILITPTSPILPQPNQAFVSQGRQDVIRQVTRHTVQLNASGQPGMSLPLGWSDDGLPIGVQFVSAEGREDLLFRLSGFLEAAMPWADRVPPINARGVGRQVA